MKHCTQKQTNMCWYIDAICLGITVGFSEVLLAIYYGSKSIDPISLAIFMTVPAAIGAIAQAATTHVSKLFRSARTLAMWSVAVQIIGLLTMVSALYANSSDQVMMFVGQCLYWIGSMTSSSPTQEILANNVDVVRHNQFFSRRAMLMTVLTLVCNLLSARILSDGLTAQMMAGFLFVAASARGLSLLMIFFFSSSSAPTIRERNQSYDHESMVCIFKLSFAMMLFRVAVNISSPFFSAYMLREIPLSYSTYSFLTAIPLVTKMLCLTNWAKLLDDNRKFEGLALATFAIGTVPILWSFGNSNLFLGMLQFFSGLSWAGFDLISVLLVQNMYPRSITQKLGLFLSLSSIGSVLGGLIGGWILEWSKSYHMVFAISGSMRIVTGFGLLWYLRRNDLFRFKDLRLKSGLATLMAVKPSLKAAVKIIPSSSRKDSRPNRAA